MTPQETEKRAKQHRAAILTELLEARRLWKACVQIEDRRAEAFAMKKLNAALDVWDKPPPPSPPRPSHL